MNNTQLYVIILHGMGVWSTVSRVYLSREEAERFIREKKHEGGPALSIEKHNVRGHYTFPNTVYAAHRYVRIGDEFEFIGLFADYDEAKRLAGKSSLVTNHEPIV
jgi:hypothetical protein